MQQCATRLQRSVQRLPAFFPIDAGRLQKLPPAKQDDVDASLKRFEQRCSRFRTKCSSDLTIRDGEDPRQISRRDVAELMERLGAIPSAKQFRDFVAVRNRLAHLYSEDPARQAANLNAAYEAAPALLLLTERVSAGVVPESRAHPRPSG
jgi:hypothetical protein